MTTYMCMCISLTNATAYKYDILIDTVSIQSTVIRELRVYPVEDSMPRASDAPFTPDILRCSKSWTTVDAGRCSQCSPTNSHHEEDGFRGRSLGRRHRTSNRGIAPQKPNRRTLRARFADERGFRRHLLSRYSVRAELWDGEVRKLLICGSLGSGCREGREAAKDPRRRRNGSGKDGN